MVYSTSSVYVPVVTYTRVVELWDEVGVPGEKPHRQSKNAGSVPEFLPVNCTEL